MRFKIADAVVGVNCPPMHPNCRCNVVTPRETDEEVQAEIDRLLDGRSIEDIERELDRQSAEQNTIEENQQKLLTTDENGGIIEIDKDKETDFDKMTDIANNVIAENDLPELASNAHPRNEQLENVIKRCIEQEHPVFADDIKTNFLKIPKEEGKYILALHGTPNSVYLYGEQADAKVLANIIRNRSDYKNEETIVLISCNTGNTTNVKTCFAQKLSNEMNKIIMAPTEYGVITARGEYFSGNKYFIKSGDFKEFKPDKEGLV